MVGLDQKMPKFCMKIGAFLLIKVNQDSGALQAKETSNSEDPSNSKRQSGNLDCDPLDII